MFEFVKQNDKSFNLKPVNEALLNDDGSIVPIRYVDKKRIQKWLNVNRVQFPLRSSIKDSINKIHNNEENVNTKNSIPENKSDAEYLNAVKTAIWKLLKGKWKN